MKQLKREQLDTLIKYAFGPRKMPLKDACEMAGVGFSTGQKIATTYRLVGNDQVDELIGYVARNDVAIATVAWAFDYHGKEMPTDYEARLIAKKRGEEFNENTPTEEQKQADADNIAVLCGRLNALGKALSDCLTEETASKLTDKLVSILTDIANNANANADNILKEMQKQTDILHRIEFNTKKRMQNQK